jgi:putative transposase
MVPDFFHPERPIDKHGDRLPHWQQGEVIQFVTFRLGDALPKEKVARWKEQRELWLSTNPKPWRACKISSVKARS